MKKYMVFVLLPLLFFVFCGRGEDDRAILEDLLESSFFASDLVMGGLDDETVNPYRVMFLQDTFPEIKWARKIDSIKRHWEIDIIGDSAYAVVDAEYIIGNLYVKDLNDSLWEKPISDTAHREIIFKKIDGRWRFYAITPIEVWTKEKKDYIKIEKIEITAKPSGNHFEISSPTHFYTRDSIFWFEPGDTVHVKVTVVVSEGDSCWAFLHHGRGYRRGVGKHHREPFYRTSVEGNTYVFERDWYISDDVETYERPVVRHGAVDILAGSTLYGDSTYSYIAHAYAMPYIIRRADEELTEDKE